MNSWPTSENSFKANFRECPKGEVQHSPVPIGQGRRRGLEISSGYYVPQQRVFPEAFLGVWDGAMRKPRPNRGAKHGQQYKHYKGWSPKAPPSRSALWRSVAEGLRMLTSLCTGGFPRIVPREGRICRCFWGLVVSTCGMAHRLRVIRSAVVARHYGIVDGKGRRTQCPYQQRRGGKHGHYSLYSTQHALLTLSFPSRVFTHAGAGMVRCDLSD